MKKTWVLLFLLLCSPSLAGEIALTFDDAPMGGSAIMSGEERTKRIIDALKTQNVDDAIFFVTTKNIRKNDENRLKSYVDAGFHLGNHSHSHKSASKISLAEYIGDIQRAKQTIDQYDNSLPYHRFPYLHYGKDRKSIDEIQSKLESMGYKNGYVTVDNYDWYLNSLLVKAKEEGKKLDLEALEKLYVDIIWDAIKFYDDLAVKTLDRSPKHVLLLHENDTSALFLPALIQHIRSNGWKIITPQEAYQDPISERLPDVVFHNQGRIAALAHESEVPVSELRSKYESSEAIDVLLESRNIFE